MNKKSTSKKRPVVARKVEPVVGPSCPSCGVPFDKHMGIVEMCMDLKDAQASEQSETRWADEYHRRVVELETAIRDCLKVNAHLADGEDCTLIGLKRVMRPNPSVLPPAAPAGREQRVVQIQNQEKTNEL